MNNHDKKGYGLICIAGALILYTFLNKYDTWDLEIIICGLFIALGGIGYLFIPQLMERYGQKMFGIGLLAAGIYCATHGILFMGLGGYLLCIAGVVLFIVNIWKNRKNKEDKILSSHGARIFPSEKQGGFV
jgi:predicted membrane channel-forming protein YqfA (hemolysin III family)